MWELQTYYWYTRESDVEEDSDENNDESGDVITDESDSDDGQMGQLCVHVIRRGSTKMSLNHFTPFAMQESWVIHAFVTRAVSHARQARSQYQPIILLRPHRLFNAFNYTTTIHCTKDHAQLTLLPVKLSQTRPQLYTECGMYCTIQNTSIECFIKYKRRERSLCVLYLIKHGLLVF